MNRGKSGALTYLTDPRLNNKRVQHTMGYACVLTSSMFDTFLFSLASTASASSQSEVHVYLNISSVTYNSPFVMLSKKIQAIVPVTPWRSRLTHTLFSSTKNRRFSLRMTFEVSLQNCQTQSNTNSKKSINVCIQNILEQRCLSACNRETQFRLGNGRQV